VTVTMNEIIERLETETFRASQDKRCDEVGLSNADARAIVDALKAGQAWNEAYYEWRFLADKGDGMPVEVEEALQAAETALAAAYEVTP
jgi:hypothetical protein